MAKQLNQNSQNTSGASARKLWIRSDVLVIAVFLAAAAIFYFVYAAVADQSGTAYCELILDGEPVMTTALDENKRFSLDALPHVEFEVRDGAIAFVASDCPDQVCVNSGYLHTSGQTAACLPNRVVIRIQSGGGADSPDIVV